MFCTQAKAYLSRKGLAFEERLVDQDEQALRELQGLGYMTTPVLKIGAEIVVGFDVARIEAALQDS